MDSRRLCLDTNTLIDYLKGREPGAAAVEMAVKTYSCYVTAITVYELLFGVARAKKEIGEQALLGVMTVLPFDEGNAKRAAALHAELIRQNQNIGIKDVFIAATCLEEGLSLLTANERHFSRVFGLTVITPMGLITETSSGQANRPPVPPKPESRAEGLMSDDFASLPREIINQFLALLHEVDGEIKVTDAQRFIDFVKENGKRYPVFSGLLKLNEEAIKEHVKRTGEAPPGIKVVKMTTLEGSNVTKLEIFLPPEAKKSKE